MAAAARALRFEGWDDLSVLHVLRHLRAADAEEVFAMRPDDGFFAVYRDLAAMLPRHLWFELVRPADRIEPVALFGVMGLSPGTGLAHLLATEDFSLTDARQVAARIRTTIIPALRREGLHRVEAVSIESHRWAHRFLRAAGATREEPRPALGKAGQDFRAFVWLARDLPPDLPPETSPPTANQTEKEA